MLNIREPQDFIYKSYRIVKLPTFFRILYNMGLRSVLLLIAMVGVFACEINTDCPEGQICDNSVCYSTPRKLYQPCSLKYYCESGLSCKQGRCYHTPRRMNEPCESDCSEGLECDSEEGVCKEIEYK
jgi:hypothetical protein